MTNTGVLHEVEVHDRIATIRHLHPESGIEIGRDETILDTTAGACPLWLQVATWLQTFDLCLVLPDEVFPRLTAGNTWTAEARELR